MKKCRVIALLTAVAMIMSAVPAFAAGFIVGDGGVVYEKQGANLVINPGFESGLNGLTDNEEYYEVTADEAHSGSFSLLAIKSTKGDSALNASFPVSDANASYYLSFWYKNTDTVSRRPRVTFAFSNSSSVIPTVEDSFTEATGAWIGAGTASNDQDMAYSDGEWVQYSTIITGNGDDVKCSNVVLSIYGLRGETSYIDDVEVSLLSTSADYNTRFETAIACWEKVTLEEGPLRGVGTLELPREVKDGAGNVIEGVKVDWTSSSATIDAETGNYASLAKEELAILTACVYVDGMRDEIYREYEYAYIVESLFEPYIQWLNKEVFANKNYIPNSITGDLKNLPTERQIAGYPDATITWSCSDPAVIDENGKFTPPETTKYVEIIATIECNGETETAKKRVKAIGGNIVADGLVMYFDFEKPLANKNELYDNSQNNNTYNATMENVTIENGYGKFSAAGSNIFLNSSFATELTGSYTVAMWVNLDKSIGMSSGMYRFFDFGSGKDTKDSQFLRYVPSTGQLSFMDRATVTDGNAFAANVEGLTGFAGTWKYITLTYNFDANGSTADIYVDGERVATSNVNSTLKRSIYSIVGQSGEFGYIGRTQWHDTDNPDYVGLMDDIRIYNRAITPEEIQLLYTETKPVVTAPVTLQYFTDDGEFLSETTVDIEVGTTYDVPAGLKTYSTPNDVVGDYRYVYKYVPSKSIDSISVSDKSENVCKLVFSIVRMSKYGISNPSFEDGVDGWTSNANGVQATVTGWIQSNEQAHEGRYSLKRNVTAGGTSPDNFATYIPIESGRKYRFSFWEYSAADVEAGNNMMSAVCITEFGDKASNSPADNPHLVAEYGGWSSWNGGHATRDPGYKKGWNKREYVFDTQGKTNANYILVAYAHSTGVDFYIDDFSLVDITDGEDTETDTDTTGMTEVKLEYYDTNGNRLADADQSVFIEKDVETYVVEDKYKTVPEKSAGSTRYTYVYNENESVDEITISIFRDNVAKLVFDVYRANKENNLVPDGGFEDENGNFSWGTWQTPSASNGNNNLMFAERCNEWFYTIDRNTGDSALFPKQVQDASGNWVNGEIAIDAEDYALGTRWHDGADGLCSMANFIPVEANKTYIVSYDYKHTTGGVNTSYISTSFVTKNDSFAVGAQGRNNPANVTKDWQTHRFTISPKKDGYIYFHFSYLGVDGNAGNGPYWFFDNFEVLEATTFESRMTYEMGNVYIYAEDGTEGYLIQAFYDDGILTEVKVSDKIEVMQDTPAKLEVKSGAKLMFVESLETLKPIVPYIMAE